MVEIKKVEVDVPEDVNVIIGQSHFIKTMEDLYEVLKTSSPDAKFGIGFCEASGDRLVRKDGNESELQKLAVENAKEIGAGHSFVIYMKNLYPINVLNEIKNVQEVCTIFCATANDVQVLIGETEQGRSVLGVVDGQPPKGIEESEDIQWRKEFLRNIGYKKGNDGGEDE